MKLYTFSMSALSHTFLPNGSIVITPHLSSSFFVESDEKPTGKIEESIWSQCLERYPREKEHYSQMVSFGEVDKETIRKALEEDKS